MIDTDDRPEGPHNTMTIAKKKIVIDLFTQKFWLGTAVKKCDFNAKIVRK